MSDTQFRPRRSVLYMPSSNERALQKARSIPCDGIIFDLEDAVAPDAKPAAREAACAAVQSGEYGRRELIIPPHQAYGPAGRHPLGGKTLIFVIDLLAVG